MVTTTERETVLQQIPAEQRFGLEVASRGMNQPDPTMQLMQQAQEMRFMSSAAAQRAELAAHEIGGLNNAYDRAPKPGGAVKGVALAGVGAGLGYIGGNKAVEFAGNVKNSEVLSKKAADFVEKVTSGNFLTNNPLAENSIDIEKISTEAAKHFGKGTDVTNAVIKTIEEAQQKSFAEGGKNIGDISQKAGDVLASGIENIKNAADKQTHKGLGGVVNNVRDFVTEKVDKDTLGKVGGTVVAVCAVTGAVLGVRHLMKENDARMSRMEAIDQAIQQKSAEHQMYADTALNNAIGAQQAETMLASTWQQKMAERGIAPRSQDASWVDRTSQQTNTPQLAGSVGI